MKRMCKNFSLSLSLTLLQKPFLLFYIFNRAMAVCISFLIGRIGCMLGSNLTGFLLENHCEIAFYISGTLLIGSFLWKNIWIFDLSTCHPNLFYITYMCCLTQHLKLIFFVFFIGVHRFGCISILHSKHSSESDEILKPNDQTFISFNANTFILYVIQHKIHLWSEITPALI